MTFTDITSLLSIHGRASAWVTINNKVNEHCDSGP